MAKTPASLTDDPKVPGRPRDFTIRVTSARVSAGAGFMCFTRRTGSAG